jgi:hypothetical protein
MVHMADRLIQSDVVAGCDHTARAIQPAITLLSADLRAVHVTRKGATQHLGQFGNREQHPHRVSVHKDHARISIDGSDCIQREKMVRALHHPTRVRPTGCLVLQVLKETPVETIGGQMPRDVAVEPASVGWNAIGRVKTQAAKHMVRSAVSCVHQLAGSTAIAMLSEPTPVMVSPTLIIFMLC